MTITALPTAPSTADPTTFAARADALIAALPTFVSEANALAVAMNLNATTDTSASSVLIGTGAKSFTVSTGKSFQPGMFLVIADTAAPSTNWMYGQVTSYATNQLVMNITVIGGSGTKTAWVISQAAAASGVLAGFGATNTTAQSLTSGAAATAAFNADSFAAGGAPAFDTSSWYNTSTHVFQPTVAGYYTFNWLVNFTGSAFTSGQADLVTAGTGLGADTIYVGSTCTTAGAANDASQGTITLYLNGGDDAVHIEVTCVATTPAMAAWSYFQGIKVG